MYPQQVSLNEDNIAKVTEIYKSAYQQLVDEIEGATDFGIARRKALLKQIDGILIELKANVDDIMVEEVRQSYQTGETEANEQLKHIGAEINTKANFDKINQDAVTALVDDTQAAFGQSIQGVRRSAQQLLSSAAKEQITQSLATGKAKGETLKQVKNTVSGVLKNQGLDALQDKAGRAWTLDRYSEMLVRTKAVEARNRGLVNRVAGNGYDLVQVSAHGATDVCGMWEGEILSISGKTPGYKTVAYAQDAGLFHPNCKHAINVLTPDLATKTKAYDIGKQDYVSSRQQLAGKLK